LILPDINLLVYANDPTSPLHRSALSWWETAMNCEQEIGLAWVVILGFVRVTTNARIFERPLSVPNAIDKVRRWRQHPTVRILSPGPKHFEIWADLLASSGAAGNLTTDSHLAALAIEHRAVLYSHDADFSRYDGLRWRNPLA
jgi:hypothetical protein